jgi:alpha/beta superfamily hydrolase
MSGGHYDYAFGRISDLADAIRNDAVAHEANSSVSRDIVCHMRFVADELDRLAEAAHDIEWFESGDYSEETLRECDSWQLSKHDRIVQDV